MGRAPVQAAHAARCMRPAVEHAAVCPATPALPAVDRWSNRPGARPRAMLARARPRARSAGNAIFTMRFRLLWPPNPQKIPLRGPCGVSLRPEAAGAGAERPRIFF